MKTTSVLIGTALTAAVGYAIAVGLARACTYAEEMESTDCAGPLPDVSSHPQPGIHPHAGVTA